MADIRDMPRYKCRCGYCGKEFFCHRHRWFCDYCQKQIEDGYNKRKVKNNG